MSILLSKTTLIDGLFVVFFVFRLRESEEEQRFKKLDEMIRNQQKAREEIAASRERRHFFKRKRKEK